MKKDTIPDSSDSPNPVAFFSSNANGDAVASVDGNAQSESDKKSGGQAIGNNGPANSDEVQPSESAEDVMKAVFKDRTKDSQKSGGRDQAKLININIASMTQTGDWNNLDSNYSRRLDPDNITSLVQKAEIDRISHVFESGSLFQTAHTQLKKERILVLHGERRSGKFTASLRILKAAGRSRILRLDDTLTLRNLQQFDFQPETGYILDSPERLAECNFVLLDTLSKRLQKGGEKSACIIISTADSHSIKPDFSQYALFWELEFDTNLKMRMLERHVSWLASENNVSDISLLQDAALIPVLEAVRKPFEIELLAGQLIRAALNDFTLEVALQQFQALGDEQMARWFADLPEEGQIFVIALAFLQDCPASEQYRCAGILRDMIHAKNGGGNFGGASNISQPDFFRLPRTEIEARTQAHFARLERNTEAGAVYTDSWRWSQPVFARNVIHLAWRELPHIRPHLLDWVSRLGSDPSVHVEVAASVGVGKLCSIAFDDIYRSILDEWVHSPEADMRNSAGLALAVAFSEGEENRVSNLLHSWSRGSNMRQCWTAAFAFSVGAGWNQPEWPMWELMQILRNDDLNLIPLTLQAIERLFTAGQSNINIYTAVLSILYFCSQEESPRRVAWSVVVFTLLMDILYYASDKKYPAILKVVDAKAAESVGEVPDKRAGKQSESWREQVAFLFLRAMNTKETRVLCYTNLRKWFTEADTRKSVRRMLRKLFYTAAIQEAIVDPHRLNTLHYLLRLERDGHPSAGEIRRDIFDNNT